jgi:hypothetical protein
MECGNGVRMITKDLKTEEFLAGMEQLSENGRNYISGLTRSLFLIENPNPSELPAEHPIKLPFEPPEK